MKPYALATGILVLIISACTPAALQTPAPPESVPSLTRLPTVTTTCETHTASLVLSASPEHLRIGDTVIISVKLINEGCVALGLPQYTLTDQSGEVQSIFDPAEPEPVVHSLGLAPGQSDTAMFELEAVASGQSTFNASASFEVHIAFPGPAYWGSSSAEPLNLIVVP